MKQMLSETEREHTMELVEVIRDEKLKEADVTRMKEVRIFAFLEKLFNIMEV